MMADAVINADTTVCERKLARKPSLKKPNAASMPPDSAASVIAAAVTLTLPPAETSPTAAAVISDAMATGPTDSVLLLPKSA